MDMNVDGFNCVCEAVNQASATVRDLPEDGGDWSKIKKGLEVGLIILVVLLVILGLIVGFNKMKGEVDDDEESDQSYY